MNVVTTSAFLAKQSLIILERHANSMKEKRTQRSAVFVRLFSKQTKETMFAQRENANSKPGDAVLPILSVVMDAMDAQMSRSILRVCMKTV